jgi:hypothetical protein
MGRLLIVHALIWSTLMIASALVMKKTGNHGASEWLVTGVYLPLWWVSEQLLRRAMRLRAVSRT